MTGRRVAGVVLAVLAATGCGDPGPDLAAAGLDPDAVVAAVVSTVHVRADACGRRQHGSGFVVAPGVVATAAHVVAGAAFTTVTAPGVDGVEGYAIAFEPGLDLALLAVHEPLAAPLEGRVAEAPEPAAVLRATPAGTGRPLPVVVARRFVATTTDIGGQAEHRRPALEIDGSVRSGDSGAAVVGGDGRVLGLVFAVSTARSDRAYALDWSALSEVLARRGTARVDTGPCVG